ncbi:tetratricopeptide repeat protein [Candidatus Thiothrix anitrata]|jgi:tetratricopeptide (TPR) repeat protein|uniref:Tetratricopeptide repeat protein n=1 Tax=Candidatus Thiothrix anitrata TaxID=2823902 RepID=A0ABX7X6Y1_9GAMM|nr:tetratricopeptide repeat protein [Candidatus Thiothrix anitrata]QTR51152.1 tetratricopeptide repeat protein [Candidatus Thiothrix anitrata]
MNVSVEMLQLLSEVGYMSCFKSDTKNAKIIMDGVDAVAGDQVPTKMGVALVELYSGRYDKAIDILQNYVLVREPDHMSAQCFLGMALKMSGKDAEAKELFDYVVKNGNDDERVIASAHLGL